MCNSNSNINGKYKTYFENSSQRVPLASHTQVPIQRQKQCTIWSQTKCALFRIVFVNQASQEMWLVHKSFHQHVQQTEAGLLVVCN